MGIFIRTFERGPQPGYSILRMNALVQFEVVPWLDRREMVDLIGSVHENVGSGRRCGLLCLRGGWCKTYNHNPQLRHCELIMSDLRLLGVGSGKRVQTPQCKVSCIINVNFPITFPLFPSFKLDGIITEFTFFW